MFRFWSLKGVLFCSFVFCLNPPLAISAEAGYLYRTTFVRAAPGRLPDLITLYKNRMSAYDASGDARPFWMRHTQGDQWDLLLLFPMESYELYYSPERVERRRKAGAADFERKLEECTAWREDLFVQGPPYPEVAKAFAENSFYHIEIFISRPGRQAELYKEREMENAYQKRLSRPTTLIFTRDQGAAWDLYTLGFFRSLKHWAESDGIPEGKRTEAARAAGFESAEAIGPYMRSLIDYHRDTLCVAIR